MLNVCFSHIYSTVNNNLTLCYSVIGMSQRDSTTAAH